ncbi:MAG: 2-phospho-L-lactate guanylyltransferase [Methanotrichaceae archaeon]
MQRPVRVIIPFRLNGAKSRLGAILSPEERRLFALAMLQDVVKAVSFAGSTAILAKPGFDKFNLYGDFSVLICDLELNDAINAFIEHRQSDGWPEDILIVMADLALLTSEVVKGILQMEGDVVLTPGRGGGTNMILIRSPRFRTQYRGLSFLKHMDFAKTIGLDARVYTSYYAACDIDEPSDLAEILIHGNGNAKSFLESIGIELSERGRAAVSRK